MDGYADRTQRAEGTLDPLEVNVAVLDDGAGHRAAWVSMDGIAVTRSLRHGLATTVAHAAGLDPRRVVVAASHTHSGPACWAGEIHPALPARVDAGEVSRVAELVGHAVSRAPDLKVEIRYAEGLVVGGGANRHFREGPHDASCGVLSLMAGETPVAVVFDYACHPTVLGPENTQWSSDWVGPARTEIRRAAGSVPVVFLQGAAGDVSPRFVRRARDQGEAARLGTLIGGVPAGLLGTGDPLPARLRFERTEFSLRTRQDLTSRPGSSSTGQDRLAASRREGQHSQQVMKRSGLAPRMTIPVSLLELGSRRWIHVAAELFTSFALELKAVDERLRTIGYCDDYAGYLADALAHANGEYEASASFFDAAETRRFADECVAQVTNWYEISRS